METDEWGLLLCNLIVPVDSRAFDDKHHRENNREKHRGQLHNHSAIHNQSQRRSKKYAPMWIHSHSHTKDLENSTVMGIQKVRLDTLVTHAIRNDVANCAIDFA